MADSDRCTPERCSACLPGGGGAIRRPVHGGIRMKQSPWRRKRRRGPPTAVIVCDVPAAPAGRGSQRRAAGDSSAGCGAQREEPLFDKTRIHTARGRAPRHCRGCSAMRRRRAATWSIAERGGRVSARRIILPQRRNDAVSHRSLCTRNSTACLTRRARRTRRKEFGSRSPRPPFLRVPPCEFPKICRRPSLNSGAIQGH
jgi:hypothetical protein